MTKRLAILALVLGAAVVASSSIRRDSIHKVRLCTRDRAEGLLDARPNIHAPAPDHLASNDDRSLVQHRGGRLPD